jgi:hypothetical protein
MKRLHVISFCFHTAAWLVPALLSPALLAEPAGDLASQLQDTLERQGWRIEKGADGSLVYWPPTTSTAVVRQPAAVEPGPADKPGEAQVQPGAQTKPASDVREEAAPLAEEPGTAVLTEAPGARSTGDMVGSAADKETPGQTSEAASPPPEPEQQTRRPQRSGYYRQPLHRPLPPMGYRPPPAGYRRAGPPCPYGPWDCGWHSRRPGSPAPGGRGQSRQNSAADE